MNLILRQPEEVYQLFKSGTPEQRQSFARTLPPSPFLDVTIPLMGSSKPGMAIVALGPTIIGYCNGSAPEVGAALALAAHRFAVELFENTPDHGLIPTTLSGLASAYTNACNIMGRSQEVLDFTKQWIPYYERLEPINVRSLKLAKAAAQINLQQLEAAAATLADETLPGNFATDMEVERLRGKLEELTGVLTKDASRGTQPPRKAPDLTGILHKLVADLPGGEELSRAVDKRDPANRADPSTAEGYAQLVDALRVGKSILTRGSSGDSEVTIRQRITEASGIFLGRPSAQQIATSQADLEQCLAWARERNVTDLQTDALWSLYLCHSRSEDPSGAADRLLELQAIVEKSRRSIVDPLKRGGAFSTYPHLFPALCEKLYRAQRIPEMLRAIEASKGRGIADLLTKKSGHPVPDPDIYGAVERMPALCVTHGFHYVTYLVDDTCVYAVLVTKAGTLHAATPIQLSRESLRSAAARVDPNGRGNGEVDRELAPLVEWLAEMLATNTVAKDDHVCVSPDDDLANVPFAYLWLDKKRRVADVFSTSRIHNAFHVEATLSKPVAKPATYVGLSVPFQQNVEADTWPRFRAALREPLDYLDSQFTGKGKKKGTRLSDTDATIERLHETPTQKAVLHFSTHGIFPRPGTKETPFEHAGLVLASASALPDAAAIRKDDRKTVLTPKRLLEHEFDFSGSHVSMMACVSGLSREGIGGDALGVEWAIVQAGATSVLSSHWIVDADVAARLLTTFYRHWLADGKSRRDAFTATIAELRSSKDGNFRDVASWAAFSLTGDWR